MALTGNTASYQLDNLLQSLYTSGSSGTLFLGKGKISREIYLSAGDILLLTFKVDAPWVGPLLYSHQLLTLKDLEITQQEQSILKLPLATLLVDKDLLRLKDLTQVVQPKLTEELYEVFLWEDAFFRFEEGKDPLEGLDPEVRRDGIYRYQIPAVIMEALRRSDEWRRIHTRLPSLKLLFKKNPSSEKITLSPLKSALLEHYHHFQHTHDFIEKSIYHKFETCLATYELLKEESLFVLSEAEFKNLFDQALAQRDYLLAIRVLEALDDLEKQDRLLLDRMQTALLSDKYFIQETGSFTLSFKREKKELVRFFLTLLLKKHSGLFEIQTPHQKKWIYFDEKRIEVRSQEQPPSENFQKFLYSHRYLTQRDFDRLETALKYETLSVQDYLLENQLLSPTRLQELLQEKILEEWVTIFLWNEPVWSFHKNSTDAFFQPPKPQDLHFEGVTSETYKELVHQFHGWETLLEKINSNRILFKQTYEGGWESLEKSTQALLEKMDGNQSLQDLLNYFPQTPFQMCQNLYQLLNKNLIRILSLRELKTNAERALLENNPIDCLKYCEFALELGEDIAFFQDIREKMRIKNIHFLDSTQTYKLEGDLKHIHLAELFQTIGTSQLSGFFLLKSASKKFPLHFVKGDLQYQELSKMPLQAPQLETLALHLKQRLP
jgi:hypothetical protein